MRQISDIGFDLAEPLKKRRKLCHSVQELVVSLDSNCEDEVGLVTEQYERQRKKRRKGEKASHCDIFNRIRQFSFTGSEPVDEIAFTIDEKAMTILPEMNLFEQENEGAGEEQLIAMPLTDINDLLDRIFITVEDSKGETEK